MFSGTIKIADIDDYIKPSQECVLPMLNKANDKLETKDELRVERIEEVQMSFPNLIKSTDKKTAKVSLNDCLACSGCVTTAETILIEQQGINEFLNSAFKKKYVVISLSPQSRVSLANFFGMDEVELQFYISNFFYSLGVRYTFDTSTAIDITMNLAKEEFIQRIKDGKQNFPLICSECPGWVCYAEKIVEEFIISHMSKVKSPQQIMGVLIKHCLPEALGCNARDIYHVTIMPCYDKKLESVREENAERENSCIIKEVDTVLSTREIIDLLNKVSGFSSKEEIKKYLVGFDKENQEAKSFEEFFMPILTPIKNRPLYINHPTASSSNAYLETMIKTAAVTIFNMKEEAIKVDIKKGKNGDYTEYHLIGEGNKLLMKFLRVYGFRNIQNFVRNIKKGKSEFHYVEVMACPSGCLNGGGQINENSLKSKDLIESLTRAYHDVEKKILRTEEDNACAKKIKEDISENKELLKRLGANFKSVKSIAASSLKW